MPEIDLLGGLGCFLMIGDLSGKSHWNLYCTSSPQVLYSVSHFHNFGRKWYSCDTLVTEGLRLDRSIWSVISSVEGIAVVFVLLHCASGRKIN